MGVKAIAALLNREERKTPAQVQRELLGKRIPAKKEALKKKYLWDGTMVKRILTDESYTGTLICTAKSSGWKRSKAAAKVPFAADSECADDA